VRTRARERTRPVQVRPGLFCFLPIPPPSPTPIPSLSLSLSPLQPDAGEDAGAPKRVAATQRVERMPLSLSLPLSLPLSLSLSLPRSPSPAFQQPSRHLPAPRAAGGGDAFSALVSRECRKGVLKRLAPGGMFGAV